jgi:hypothetical protein
VSATRRRPNRRPQDAHQVVGQDLEVDLVSQPAREHLERGAEIFMELINGRADVVKAQLTPA